MREANRRGNQIRIQRVSSVLPKELGIRWEQGGIQDLQNSREVNLRIFRVGMIAMNQNRNDGQQQQASDTFDGQRVIRPFSDVSRKNYNRKYPRQEAGVRLQPAQTLRSI